MLENERSFLVREMPDLPSASAKDIEQYYLSDSREPLRLRREGGRAELTKKLMIDPADLSRREELNIPLSKEEYDKLRPLAARGLSKRRYHVALEHGLVAEIDVFRGALDGFAKIEVEFPDEASRAAFRPPEWFGREVSLEPWSSNAWLAGKTFADVAPHLE